MFWLSLGNARALEVNRVLVNMHAASPTPARLRASFALLMSTAGSFALGALSVESVQVHFCKV